MSFFVGEIVTLQVDRGIPRIPELFWGQMYYLVDLDLNFAALGE